MSATSVLEWYHSGLQVSAGWAETDRPDVRYLLVGVSNTHDSVRLDWYDGTDFASDTPVPARLTIGTLPAREVRVGKGEIEAGGLAEERHFGPTAAGILHAIAEPLTHFALAHPDVLRRLEERVSALNGSALNGKVPKDIGTDTAGTRAEDPFADSVVQYRAAGSALGALIAGGPEVATATAALASLVGVTVFLTD
jgi:hypothetical protein